MQHFTPSHVAARYLRSPPTAIAALRGAPEHPHLGGNVRFWQTPQGALVMAEVWGLPQTSRAPCDKPVFAMHIHAGTQCTGNPQDPFAGTQGHFNPDNCPHPAHAGDLPPLFSNGGWAWCALLTDRFTVGEIIGRTLIIHAHPDDFKTQPSGDADGKIACGRIMPA